MNNDNDIYSTFLSTEYRNAANDSQENNIQVSYVARYDVAAYAFKRDIGIWTLQFLHSWIFC
jgi:hypothetical protein